MSTLATSRGADLNALTILTPMTAVELVEAAGIDDARTIIADFTAAGLVKSYALKIEIIDANGKSACVRQAAVPPEIWERIVLDGVTNDVWTSGTVRLAGSDLIGGTPTALVTAITFHPRDIDWLISHHKGVSLSKRRKRKTGQAPAVIAAPLLATTGSPPVVSKRRQPDPTAIARGAMLATIEQTMRATGLSRGTINNLLKRGTLVRKETGLRSVSIEVASIRGFSGLSD